MAPTRWKGKHNPYAQQNVAHGVDFTIEPAAAFLTTVTIQLKDANGRNVAQPCGVDIYLTSEPDGADYTQITSTTFTLTEGTEVFRLATDSSGHTALCVSGDVGRLVLEIDAGAAHTGLYLACVMPDGRVVVSPELEFTA